MIKKNIEIKINSKTRQVFFDDNFLGIQGENLQGYLIFKFEDEFVDGIPLVKVEQNGEKYDIYEVIKENETYKMLIKSSLLKSDIVYIVLTITESGTKDGIPKFISKKFHMYVGDTIETTQTIPDEYDSWIDTANDKINEINKALTQVDNLNIDANKVENIATINITKKDGLTQTVEIYDGKNGEKGESNKLTIGEVVDGEEANATITGESPNQILNLTLPRGETGKSGVYVGSEEPTDEEIKVWIDTEGKADLQSEVSASEVLFDDEETLQQKFDNGDLGGGSSNAIEVLDLKQIPMMDVGYNEELGAHGVKIVGTYMQNTLNELKEKYISGQPLPKIICEFKCSEAFAKGEETYEETDIYYYNVELKPFKQKSMVINGEIEIGFETEITKFMMGLGFVKHIIQFWNMSNEWLILANFVNTNPKSDVVLDALYGVPYQDQVPDEE